MGCVQVVGVLLTLKLAWDRYLLPLQPIAALLASAALLALLGQIKRLRTTRPQTRPNEPPLKASTTTCPAKPSFETISSSTFSTEPRGSPSDGSPRLEWSAPAPSRHTLDEPTHRPLLR